MASRAVAIPGTMVEQGSQAAVVDQGTQAAMADQGTGAAMADQGTRAAIAIRGLRGPWWVTPSKKIIGDVQNLWGGALEWTL